MKGPEIEIACQQVLIEETAVFSMQSMTLPESLAQDVTAEFLLQRYLKHIRLFTAGLIQPRQHDDEVAFRLLWSRWNLLRFRIEKSSQPEAGSMLRLQICGGFLVQADSCDRGELSFEVKPLPNGVSVALQLSDYCPLLLGGPRPNPWRKGLYHWTQAALHKLVTIRFLLLLYRDLAGSKACCRVVRRKVMEGEDI